MSKSRDTTRVSSVHDFHSVVSEESYGNGFSLAVWSVKARSRLHDSSTVLPLLVVSFRFLTYFVPPLSESVPSITRDGSRRYGPRSQSEMEEALNYTFSPYMIDRPEVFHSTLHSFAMVNLRPLELDVLVCPRQEVKSFIDLTADEVCDLWLTAKEVGGCLKCHHEASSLMFAIQDGCQAGQTVPRVHIHILPRKKGDFEKNDEIYYAIDLKEKELKETLDLDKEKKDRTP